MTKVKIVLAYRYCTKRYKVYKRAYFFFWSFVAMFDTEEAATKFAHELKDFPKYV